MTAEKPGFPPRIFNFEYNEEYVPRSEMEASMTRAREDGEKIGRLKKELEYADFKVRDPSELHAIRKINVDRANEIRFELWKLDEAARKDAKGDGDVSNS